MKLNDEQKHFYFMVGQMIRARRKERKISTQDLAAETGINRSTIENLERGYTRTSMYVIVKILNILTMSCNVIEDAYASAKVKYMSNPTLTAMEQAL